MLPHDGIYEIRAMHSDKCLDVPIVAIRTKSRLFSIDVLILQISVGKSQKVLMDITRLGQCIATSV